MTMGVVNTVGLNYQIVHPESLFMMTHLEQLPPHITPSIVDAGDVPFSSITATMLEEMWEK